MRVLGLVCSPRLNGNTEILVQKVLSSIQEQGVDTEMIHVAKKHILPCDGCGSCRKDSKCCVNDNMQEIYSNMLSVDGIIIGTPVYFWSISAQAKIIIDRTYSLLHHRLLRNKVAGIVVVAKRAGCTSAFNLLQGVINLHRMHLAGGVTGFGDKKGDVLNDADGINQTAALGKAMVTLMKKFCLV